MAPDYGKWVALVPFTVIGIHHKADHLVGADTLCHKNAFALILHTVEKL